VTLWESACPTDKDNPDAEASFQTGVVPEMCVEAKTAIACFSFRLTSTWRYAS